MLVAGRASVSYYNPAEIPAPGGVVVAGRDSVSYYNPATIPSPDNSIATNTASVTYYNPAQIPSPSGALAVGQSSVSYYNPAAVPTLGADISAVTSVSYDNPPMTTPDEAPSQQSAVNVARNRRRPGGTFP